MDEPPNIPESQRGPIGFLMPGVLAVVTIALFARAATFDFVSFDDYDYIVRNTNLQRGVSLDSIKWAFTSGELSNWHPLTWISYLVEISTFGVRPGPMHAVNLILHAANTVLIYLVLARSTGHPWPSAWVAALFAWHPLHVESVAWIAERKDVLCAFFAFLCLLQYIRYSRSPGRMGYLAVVILLILALLSKPMAVTLPFVMLLLDFWPLRRAELGRTIRSLVLEKVPLLAVVLGSAIVTVVVQSGGQSVVPIDLMPLGSRVANAVVAYATYLRMTIAPYGLAIFYPHPATLPGMSISPVAVVGSVLLIAALSGVAWLNRGRRPWIIVGWLWFLGTLVPVIGIVQVGRQALADRYTYIPLIGIFIAVSWTAREIANASGRAGRAAISGVGVAVLLLALVATWRQVGFWRDTETVMVRAIAVVPNNYVAHANLAGAKEAKGDGVGAIQEYQTILAMRPEDPLAMYNLGRLNAKLGRTAESIDYFERAIGLGVRTPETYNELGNVLVQGGKIEDAVRAYQAALAGDPGLHDVHYNLAIALARLGRMTDAIPHWQQAIALRPGFAEAHLALGEGLLATGHPREGLAHLGRAADLAQTQGKAELSRVIRDRIELHQRQQPPAGQ